MTLFTMLILAGVVFAGCPRGEQLLWEDEQYWHCGTISSAGDVKQVLERAELLGEDWQYRKRLIEAVRSLKDYRYQWSAKFDVSIDSKRTHFCSACERDTDEQTVDCSGAAAYGQLSACVVSGFCKTAYPELRQGLLGPKSNAAFIASFFYENGAFNSGPPTPGDLIFFSDNGRPKTRHGITHVAIYLGDLSTGEKVVFHAVGSSVRTAGLSNKAGFQNLKPTDDLLTRIVGYGNVSKLVRSLQQP